jgi:hypothetical protein
MGRPAKVVPTVNKTIALSGDVWLRIEAELYSPLEGKIPFGEHQRFFDRVLRAHFEQQDANAPAATAETAE